MDVAHNKVDTGKEATLQTKEVLNVIVESVTQAMEMIQQIATATNQQSTTAEGISSSLETISTVTRQSAGGTEKLAHATDQLNRQTEDLRKLISLFKLHNDNKIAQSVQKPGSDKATHNSGLGKMMVNSRDVLKKLKFPIRNQAERTT